MDIDRERGNERISERGHVDRGGRFRHHVLIPPAGVLAVDHRRVVIGGGGLKRAVEREKTIEPEKVPRRNAAAVGRREEIEDITHWMPLPEAPEQ